MYLSHATSLALSYELHFGEDICFILTLLIKHLRNKYISNVKSQDEPFLSLFFKKYQWNSIQNCVEYYLVQGLECFWTSRSYTFYVKLLSIIEPHFLRSIFKKKMQLIGNLMFLRYDFILCLLIINQMLKSKIWWYMITGYIILFKPNGVA